jgi:hypothetical protein
MKRGFLTLLLAAALAAGGYSIYYRWATAPARGMMTRGDGGMEWLRIEYHLSDPQFARIGQLHREYAPKCAVMCEKIMKANARLDELIGANKAVTPELEAALKESSAVEDECRQAMLGHIYAVSSEMSPPDGARYLRLMRDRIVQRVLSQETAVSESSK